MKRDNQNQVKKRIIKKCVQGLLSLLLIAIVLSLPRIKKLECLVDNQQDDDFCSQLLFLENKSLFFTNFEKTPLFQQVLVNDLGQVFLPVNIQKRLPSTLLITLSKEDPLYRISFEDKTFLVNSMDFLAEDSQQFAVPNIQLSQDYAGCIDDKKLDPALNIRINELTKALKSAGLSFDEIIFDKQNSSLQINGFKFIFSDDENLAFLVSRINLILSDAKSVESQIPDDKKLKEIDMRFDLPIVRFE